MARERVEAVRPSRLAASAAYLVGFRLQESSKRSCGGTCNHLDFEWPMLSALDQTVRRTGLPQSELLLEVATAEMLSRTE